MNKKILFIILTAFILLTSCGCKPNTQLRKSDKLHIITTIFPAYDFSKCIVGDLAQVDMLLPPGSEVHTFDPTPKDMINIRNCDLFIYNGGESDEWVEKLLSSNEYKDLNTLCMMDNVDVVNEEEVNDLSNEHDEEDEADEHIWTSPVNAIKISESIMESLCDIDIKNAPKYKAQFEIYKSQLSKLDREFREFSENSKIKTLVFADRFPMRYFADEYGFTCYAAFPGCSAQSEPSAATIVFLIDKIKSENLPAVFCMEFSDGRMADTVCYETNAKKYYLHSCHNVTAEDFKNGVSYISLMENNLEVLKKALSDNNT